MQTNPSIYPWIAIIAAIPLLGCPAADDPSTQASWRTTPGLVAYAALDVTTPRSLIYQVTKTDSEGNEDDFEVALEIDDHALTLPLMPFFGVDEEGGYEIDERGYVTQPDGGAVPGVLMLLDSVPEDDVQVGTQWERRRPSDADADAMDAAVMQSRREFLVTQMWDTDDGVVARVQVSGTVRWFPNAYRQQVEDDHFTLPTEEWPDHFGYVDVNLGTGTVVDALVHTELLSDADGPAQLVGDPDASTLRLCPGSGAEFIANEDTCG